MPTLVRLLTALAMIAVLTVAVMAALVYFVEPRRTEIRIEVPLKGLEPPALEGEPVLPPE